MMGMVNSANQYIIRICVVTGTTITFGSWNTVTGGHNSSSCVILNSNVGLVSTPSGAQHVAVSILNISGMSCTTATTNTVVMSHTGTIQFTSFHTTTPTSTTLFGYYAHNAIHSSTISVSNGVKVTSTTRFHASWPGMFRYRSKSIPITSAINLTCYIETDGYMYAKINSDVPVKISNTGVMTIPVCNRISDTQVYVVYIGIDNRIYSQLLSST